MLKRPASRSGTSWERGAWKWSKEESEEKKNLEKELHKEREDKKNLEKELQKEREDNKKLEKELQIWEKSGA